MSSASFAGYAENREPFLGVMRKAPPASTTSTRRCPLRPAAKSLAARGMKPSGSATRLVSATVRRPCWLRTGTIGFMMDCDTTGVEPDIALVKYKRLVGGGMLKIVNNGERSSGSPGVRRSAASEDHDVCERARDHRRAPGLRADHPPVFDCAFRPQNGVRSIHRHGSPAHDGRDAALPVGRDQ